MMNDKELNNPMNDDNLNDNPINDTPVNDAKNDTLHLLSEEHHAEPEVSPLMNEPEHGQFTRAEAAAVLFAEPEAITEMAQATKSSRSQPGKYKQMLSLVLIGAVVGGMSIGAGSELVRHQLGDPAMGAPYVVASPVSSSEKQVAYNQSDKNITDIAEQVGPSVVSITSKVAYSDYFNNVGYSEGAGSGIIFKSDANYFYVLTNNHVIEGAEELVVQIKQGELQKAEVVGKDQSTDLAVIKIPKKGLSAEVLNYVKVAVLGDSDKIKVGETAVAIGNPLGYSDSVTVGVISAVGRELKDQNSLKLLQTDAAINPGNSGGALVNGRGEVVGINSVKIASSDVENIGFAIPINSAKPIIESLLTKGFVSRPYLGIYGVDVSQEASSVYNLPIGVYVKNVIENSGAAKAGMKNGDIIISIDSNKVNTMKDLTDYLSKKKVGDTVTVKIVRESGTKVELTVKLQDANK